MAAENVTYTLYVIIQLYMRALQQRDGSRLKWESGGEGGNGGDNCKRAIGNI